ncbi:uncharacterized protein LOC120076132 [Benincasa hispida]|uniref:uncharacterized protein LOC120076132 n=1 Tax=Benincasa hispida TaxID=102211 RepID=UPI0018FF78D6|nr:uncharacterized protein LOC120076132 [Benincasa hispida]
MVGDDFCDVVLNFFETCYLPGGVNSTAITLIPKRWGAERACGELQREQREVALCAKGRPSEGLRFDELRFLFGVLLAIAERDSLEFVRQVLTEFVKLSGLVTNVGKSSMFVAGVESVEVEVLAVYMGVSLGSLPFRYLGLPLLAGRLRVVDCAPLIQRITARIRSWAVRSLSFAGRLQLVSYLWKGSVVSRGSAQVAWDEVCLPLEEGGLGVKHVAAWNQAAIMNLDARLSEFMDGEGGWRWSTVSWELLKIWGFIQAVRPRERNRRLYGGRLRLVSALVHLMVSTVRARATSWRVDLLGLI